MWRSVRIDKWKAKHEAMLKLAAAEEGKFSSRNGTPSPPADQRKLVITMSEKEEEEDDEEELEEEEEEQEEEEEEESDEKKLENFRKETAQGLATRSLNTALVV
jgi:hypothetical protein